MVKFRSMYAEIVVAIHEKVEAGSYSSTQRRYLLAQEEYIYIIRIIIRKMHLSGWNCL